MPEPAAVNEGAVEQVENRPRRSSRIRKSVNPDLDHITGQINAIQGQDDDSGISDQETWASEEYIPINKMEKYRIESYERHMDRCIPKMKSFQECIGVKPKHGMPATFFEERRQYSYYKAKMWFQELVKKPEYRKLDPGDSDKKKKNTADTDASRATDKVPVIQSETNVSSEPNYIRKMMLDPEGRKVINRNVERLNELLDRAQKEKEEKEQGTNQTGCLGINKIENKSLVNVKMGFENEHNICYAISTIQSLFPMITGTFGHSALQSLYRAYTEKDKIGAYKNLTHLLDELNFYTSTKTKKKQYGKGGCFDLTDFLADLLSMDRSLENLFHKFKPKIIQKLTLTNDVIGGEWSKSKEWDKITLLASSQPSIQEAMDDLLITGYDLVVPVGKLAVLDTPDFLLVTICYAGDERMIASEDLEVKSYYGERKAFTLKSIACHEGSTESGHYTSMRRIGKRFWHFNDGLAVEIKRAVWDQYRKGGKGKRPILAVYQATDSKVNREDDEQSSDSDTSKIAARDMSVEEEVEVKEASPEKAELTSKGTTWAELLRLKDSIKKGVEEEKDVEIMTMFEVPKETESKLCYMKKTESTSDLSEVIARRGICNGNNICYCISSLQSLLSICEAREDMEPNPLNDFIYAYENNPASEYLSDRASRLCRDLNNRFGGRDYNNGESNSAVRFFEDCVKVYIDSGSFRNIRVDCLLRRWKSSEGVPIKTRQEMLRLVPKKDTNSIQNWFDDVRLTAREENNQIFEIVDLEPGEFLVLEMEPSPNQIRTNQVISIKVKGEFVDFALISLLLYTDIAKGHFFTLRREHPYTKFHKYNDLYLGQVEDEELETYLDGGVSRPGLHPQVAIYQRFDRDIVRGSKSRAVEKMLDGVSKPQVTKITEATNEIQERQEPLRVMVHARPTEEEEEQIDEDWILVAGKDVKPKFSFSPVKSDQTTKSSKTELPLSPTSTIPIPTNPVIWKPEMADLIEHIEEKDGDGEEPKKINLIEVPNKEEREKRRALIDDVSRTGIKLPKETEVILGEDFFDRYFYEAMGVCENIKNYSKYKYVDMIPVHPNGSVNCYPRQKTLQDWMDIPGDDRTGGIKKSGSMREHEINVSVPFLGDIVRFQAAHSGLGNELVLNEWLNLRDTDTVDVPYVLMAATFRELNSEGKLDKELIAIKREVQYEDFHEYKIIDGKSQKGNRVHGRDLQEFLEYYNYFETAVYAKSEIHNIRKTEADEDNIKWDISASYAHSEKKSSRFLNPNLENEGIYVVNSENIEKESPKPQRSKKPKADETPEFSKMFPRVEKKKPRTQAAQVQREKKLRKLSHLLEQFRRSRDFRLRRKPIIREPVILTEDVTIQPYDIAMVKMKVDSPEEAFHHLNELAPESDWFVEMSYIFADGSTRMISNCIDKEIKLPAGTVVGMAERLDYRKFPALIKVLNEGDDEEELERKREIARERKELLDAGVDTKTVTLKEIGDWPDGTKELMDMLDGKIPPPILSGPKNSRPKGKVIKVMNIGEDKDVVFHEKEDDETPRWYINVLKNPESFKVADLGSYKKDMERELTGIKARVDPDVKYIPPIPEENFVGGVDKLEIEYEKSETSNTVTYSIKVLNKDKQKVVLEDPSLKELSLGVARALGCGEEKPEDDEATETTEKVATEAPSDATESDELPSVRASRIFEEKMKETYEPLANVLRQHKNLFIPEDPGQPFQYSTLPPVAYQVREDCPEILKCQYKKSFTSEPEKQQYLDMWLRNQLDAGMIRKSESTITSPIMMVPKRDIFRVVIDVRQVNKRCLKPVNKVMPSTEEYWRKFAHYEIFSTIDISSAYHRIVLIPEHFRFTAFEITEGPMAGTYEYMSLGQGLSQSGAVFMERMRELFAGLPGATGHLGDREDNLANPYLDDVMVGSEGLDQHTLDMKRVMARLQKANLKLDISKSLFGRTSVEFLGLTVGNGEIRTTPSRTAKLDEVLLRLPTLGTKGENKWAKFFGPFGYYRKFIPNYSKIEAEIKEHNETCKQNKDPELKEKLQARCLKLAEGMVKSIRSQVLHAPPPLTDLVIKTDASINAIGYTLETPDRRPIAFGGKIFSKMEFKMSVFEKELFALSHAVTKFEPYMRRAKSTMIKSDNLAVVINNVHMTPITMSICAIKHLLNIQNRIAGIEVRFDHISGLVNVMADEISRLNSKESRINYMEAVTRTRSQQAMYDELEALHQETHAGVTRMIKLANEHGIKTTKVARGLIDEVITDCEFCRVHRKCLANNVIGMTETPSMELKELHVDLVELTRTSAGNKYVFTMTDPFSKMGWAFPTETKKPSEVAPFLKSVLTSHPTIETILADNAYECTAFNEIGENMDVKFRFTSSHNSKENSVESWHSLVRAKMEAYMPGKSTPKGDWEYALSDFVKGYNKTPSTVTGFSPRYICYAILPESLLDRDPRYMLSKRRMRQLVFQRIIKAKNKYVNLPASVPKLLKGAEVTVRYDPDAKPFKVTVVEDLGLNVRCTRVNYEGPKKTMTFHKSHLYMVRKEATSNGVEIDGEALRERQKILKIKRIEAEKEEELEKESHRSESAKDRDSKEDEGKQMNIIYKVEYPRQRYDHSVHVCNDQCDNLGLRLYCPDKYDHLTGGVFENSCIVDIPDHLRLPELEVKIPHRTEELFGKQFLKRALRNRCSLTEETHGRKVETDYYTDALPVWPDASDNQKSLDDWLNGMKTMSRWTSEGPAYLRINELTHRFVFQNNKPCSEGLKLNWNLKITSMENYEIEHPYVLTGATFRMKNGDWMVLRKMSQDKPFERRYLNHNGTLGEFEPISDESALAYLNGLTNFETAIYERSKYPMGKDLLGDLELGDNEIYVMKKGDNAKDSQESDQKDCPKVENKEIDMLTEFAKSLYEKVEVAV